MIGPTYDNFCRLVRARSGLVLGPEKAYLVRSRLDPIARGLGMTDAEALVARAGAPGGEALLRRCVDALATHESSFFRDGAPFERLAEEILPALAQARRDVRRLRIWCAACSSGQEPYSLAILLREMAAAFGGWTIDIIATDMSEAILEKARAGLYSDFEVRRGLSPERLQRWFTPVGEGGYRIDPALQRMVTFRPHNLLAGVDGMGSFDLVLCRNVLIYFDVDRKREVLANLARVLASDGALVLGSAETILGLCDAVESAPGGRGLYRRKASAAAA